MMIAINIVCKKTEKVFLPQRKEKQTKQKQHTLVQEDTGAILIFHFCVS